ncbi:rhsC, partial [Symbiodinium sp. CCMP2456]
GNGDPDSPADLYVGSYGQLVSATNNLIGSAVDDSSTAPDITSQVGFSTKEFRIADLAFNGGPTRTHALLPGSIAIDAGSIAYDYSDATDQRGVGFPRVLGEAIDFGALEADAPIVVTTLSDEPSIGQLTLREAIAQASANQVITFAPWLNGGVLSLSAQSDLVIEKTLTIDASSLDQGLTIQAYDPDRLELGYQLFNANGGRVFYVKGRDVDLTLRGLTLSGGDTWSDGGAIYSLGASLTLDHVEVSHNASPRAPGYEIIGNTGFVDYPRDDPMNFAPIFGEYQTAARGGGVFSTGDLTIIDSLFVNNAIFNIFAGDIYTMGNLIIEGSRFETTPIDKDDITSGLAIGVPTNDNNLGLGGIYSTNERRGLPITVTINDVEFDTSRGIAVDTLYFADQTKFPSSIRRGDVARYEISEVRGGFLYLPDPNNQIAPEERPHLLSVLPGEYESIRFKHDGSATVPSFKIRVVFDGDLATEWLPISGTLNQEGAHSGSGGLDIDVGGEFDLDAVSSLLDGLNKKNTVVINNVTMVDSIGLMVVEPREKPEGLKELAAGGDGFIRYPAGSFVFLNANVSAQNLTVHHASTAGAAVAVLWSDVVIDDSRFLPPEGLDVGSGSTAVLAKASQLTITDSVFQGLRGPVIDVDLWGKLELIQSTIFNIQGDNAIRAAASFTETPAFPFAFPGSILIRDSVIRGVDRGSALAVFAPTSVTPEPEEPGENYDELPPEQDKLVHFSVREVLPFQVTIDGSTISNNRTYYGAGDAQTSGFGGAGLNLRGPLDVYITNSTISDNRQIGDSRDGGPVTDLSLLADPDNGLFNDLQYDGGFGGGIAAESMHRLRIENSTISGNQAGIAGGGIFISNTEHLELINATVTDNEAGYQGGGVFVVGGILGDIDDRYYIPTNDNAATFVNTIIAGNIAWNLGLFHDDPDPWVKTADEIDPNYGDGNGYFAIHSENTHD